jgi:hypothetical protein
VVKIVLSKTARLDLKEIVDYIKRDSIKYAFLEKEKIKEAIITYRNTLCQAGLFPNSIITILGNLFSEITESFTR